MMTSSELETSYLSSFPFGKKKYYIYILTRAGVIFKYKILCK